MCDRFVDSFTKNVVEKMKNPLKLYHVALPGEMLLGYDSYSEFVVAAYSEEEARNTHPGGEWFSYEGDWIAKDKVEKLLVKEIGNASETVEPGVIVSSFHEG